MPTAKLRYPGLRRDLYASGSTKDWGRALPDVVRLLADRRSDAALPACPLVRAGEDRGVTFNRALSYWTALDHLLRYQMGWTHQAQGLARWLDEGADDVCPALSLVRHVWLGDSFLPRYMAWRVQQAHDHLPAAWTARFGEFVHDEREGTPIGPWKLHLEESGLHVTAPEVGAPPKLVWLCPFDPTGGASSGSLVGESEPVLLFRGSLESGWYGALQQCPVGQVWVVSEEHGLCGRFHRSTSSGRWHTAPENAHLWGVRTP